MSEVVGMDGKPITKEDEFALQVRTALKKMGIDPAEVQAQTLRKDMLALAEKLIPPAELNVDDALKAAQKLETFVKGKETKDEQKV